MSGPTDWHVLDTGTLTTVQDLGRPGHAHLGVPRAGALDLPAAALANRLVGNDAAAAVLEITFGGLALRAGAGRWVAVTGAPGPVSVDGAARSARPPNVTSRTAAAGSLPTSRLASAAAGRSSAPARGTPRWA